MSRLSAGYGAAPVLNDVALTLRRGEVVALLGANGAGKSTLMRVLAGLHRPVQGGLNFDGRDLVPAGSRAHRGARASSSCPKAARYFRSSRCATT